MEFIKCVFYITLINLTHIHIIIEVAGIQIKERKGKPPFKAK
jgi:hypothetical protein